MSAYVVWFDVLGGDDRSTWDSSVLTDERVSHHWDADRELGLWLPQRREFAGLVSGELAWDVYLLFGPEATWEEAPLPMVSGGGPIFDRRDRLRDDLVALV